MNLTVNQAESLGLKVAREGHQCQFRKHLRTEHRFAKECLAKRNTVEPSYKESVVPHLNGMPVTEFVQINISGFHLGRNPSAVRPSLRIGRHVSRTKKPIKGYPVDLFSDQFSETAGNNNAAGFRTSLRLGDHQVTVGLVHTREIFPGYMLLVTSQHLTSRQRPAAHWAPPMPVKYGKTGASIGSNQGNGITKTSRRGISRRPVQPCSQILHWSPLGGRPGPRCHRPQIHRKYWFALPCHQAGIDHHAAVLHVQLTFENVRVWHVPDGDKDPIYGYFERLIDMAYPSAIYPHVIPSTSSYSLYRHLAFFFPFEQLHHRIFSARSESRRCAGSHENRYLTGIALTTAVLPPPITATGLLR